MVCVPNQGWFAIHGLALANVNLSTKFKVYNSTHYEGTKGDRPEVDMGPYLLTQPNRTQQQMDPTQPNP